MTIKEKYNQIVVQSKMTYAEEGLFPFISYWLFWILRKIKIKYLFYFGYNNLKRHPKLVNTIKGQRILILGSGPSARDLKHIPKDVKILSCHASPKLLVDRKIDRRIDIYYGLSHVLVSTHKTTNIPMILSKTRPRIFITENPRWVKKRAEYKNCYDLLIKESGFNSYYFKKLIHPVKINEICKHPGFHTSTGMRMLQYALFFGAKEIYMSGIDLGGGDYFWKGEKCGGSHSGMDHVFMKIISKKYKNIYSVSKNSPITKYIKHKTLK